MEKIIKHINRIKLLVFIVLLSSACNEVMDKEPKNLISDETAWGDPNIVLTYVNSRYNQVGHGWPESWMSSVCDETYLIWSRGCEEITQSTVTPSNLGRMNGGWWGWDNRQWKLVWGNISACNQILDNLEGVSFTDETLYDQVRGEVIFIRALMYFDLLHKWGAMPIITKYYDYLSVNEIANIRRNTYEENINFIVSQCDSAANLLPESFRYYKEIDNFRATAVAALALKSRVLLYAASPLMNDNALWDATDPDFWLHYKTPDPDRWQKAADAAQACIDLALNNGYKLFNEYEDVTENYVKLFLEYNSEVIFSRNGSSSEDGESITYLDQSNGPSGVNLWGGNCPIAQLADAFENADGTPFDWSNPASVADPFNNRDPRFKAYISCNNDIWQDHTIDMTYYYDSDGKNVGGGPDTKKAKTNYWNASTTGYNMRKFLDETYEPDSWVFAPHFYIWFRLGEQYLNLAEALYEIDNEDGARQAVNVIRERAGMLDITVTGEELREAIRHERRIELAFEEHRYFDIRRWEIANEVMDEDALGIEYQGIISAAGDDTTYHYEQNVLVEERLFDESKMYYLPIPEEEVDKNSNFGQNPGF